MTALAEAPKKSFLAHVRDGDVGGVILVGRWSSSAQMAQASRTLQAAACERGTPLLLAVDQEGGPMRRLPWNASYPELDPSERSAVFSRAIVTGLLRGTLGFDGVVVTDALDAPAPAATPHAPARAIAAGVDLLLYTSGSAARHGYESLLRDAQASARLRLQIAAAAQRIQALKDWLGSSC